MNQRVRLINVAFVSPVAVGYNSLVTGMTSVGWRGSTPWTYRVCKPVVWLGLHLACRWRVQGRENIPRQGPLIVVANHMTNWDPPLLSLSIGRFTVFMGKEGLFRSRLLRRFVSGLGIFPVGRGRMDRRALRSAQGILSGGLVLAMFPEGTRSQDARLQPAHPGSAWIALRSGVPVVPAAIAGTQTLAPGKRRPRVTVSFGRPFLLESECGSDRAECTDYIMGRIAELLPAEHRGVYARSALGVGDEG